MKMEINRKQLKNALETVSGVVPSRPALPILAFARLTARDGTLGVRGTSLDTTVTARIACGAGDMDVAVKHGALLAAVASMAGERVTLDAQGTAIAVTDGRSRFRVPALDAVEFPTVPEPPEKAAFTIKAAAMRDAIRAVQHAASKDSTRKSLQGVLVEQTGRQVRFVATDGTRLAMVELPNVRCGKEQFTLPTATAALLARLLPDGNGEVRVSVGEQVRIETDALAVDAKALAAEFPAYRRVIPDDGGCVATLRTGDALDLMRRADVAADMTGFSAVKASLGADGINATAGQGAFEESVAAKWDGGDIEIMFDGHKMLEAVSSVGTETMRMALTAPTHPIKILSEDGIFTEVVMPFRPN